VTFEKTPTAIENMKDHEYLVSTYKCMNSCCTFHTFVWEEYKAHMEEEHAKSDKYFLCSTCLSSFDKLKVMEPDDSDEEDGLFEHIESFHRFDRYQCSNCCYRTCEKLFCDIHRKKFHKNEDPPASILRGSQLHLKKHRNEIEKSLRKQMKKHIKPMDCRCELKL
jgi:hypothetical protein